MNIHINYDNVLLERSDTMTNIPNEDKNELSKYFSKEELQEAAKELKDMEKHPEKYKSYNNVEELFKDLESD